MKQTVVAQQEQCRPRAAHSQALDLLRFPLAIVVLTVHTFSAMFMNMLLPTMWESTCRKTILDMCRIRFVGLGISVWDWLCA